MNLVRLGHYHSPTGADDAGFCQTALVVGVGKDTVNLVVWSHEGAPAPRPDVAVESPQADFATFHLSADCPWSR